MNPQCISSFTLSHPRFCTAAGTLVTVIFLPVAGSSAGATVVARDGPLQWLVDDARGGLRVDAVLLGGRTIPRSDWLRPVTDLGVRPGTRLAVAFARSLAMRGGAPVTHPWALTFSRYPLRFPPSPLLGLDPRLCEERR